MTASFNVNTNIEEEIKTFLGIEISEVKKHPVLKELQLTNKEVLIHYEKIKQVLDSATRCGDNKKSCNTLQQHFGLERNSDNVPILKKIKCLKHKNLEKINHIDINNHIKKFLHKSSIQFDFQLIENLIKELNSNKNLLIIKIFEHLENEFITSEIQQIKNKAILNTFICLINNKYSILTDTQDLKKICLKNHYSFKSDSADVFAYKNLLEIDALIILNLGLEDEFYKQNYFLDWLPSLLEKRMTNNKTTQIFSPFTWNTIYKEINNFANGKLDKNVYSKDVTKYKLQILNKMMMNLKK